MGAYNYLIFFLGFVAGGLMYILMNFGVQNVINFVNGTLNWGNYIEPNTAAFLSTTWKYTPLFILLSLFIYLLLRAQKKY